MTLTISLLGLLGFAAGLALLVARQRRETTRPYAPRHGQRLTPPAAQATDPARPEVEVRPCA